MAFFAASIRPRSRNVSLAPPFLPTMGLFAASIRLRKLIDKTTRRLTIKEVFVNAIAVEDRDIMNAPRARDPRSFDRKFPGGSCRAGKFALITWATINLVMVVYHVERGREKGRSFKDTELRG